MKKKENWYKKALESCADRLREKVTQELKKSLEIHSPSKEWPQAIPTPAEQKEYRLTILGTVWTLREAVKEDDPGLENCDGYTDRSTKTMVVQGKGATRSSMPSFTRAAWRRILSIRSTGTRKRWLTGLPFNSRRCWKYSRQQTRYDEPGETGEGQQ